VKQLDPYEQRPSSDARKASWISIAAMVIAAVAIILAWSGAP
jgi:hypothetical protein